MKPTALLIAGFCLIGCLKTRAELRGEAADEAPQRQILIAQRGKAPAVPAAAHTEQEDLFEQLRLLNGRVDSVENQVVQLNAAHAGDKDGVAREKQAIEAKFVAYEEALKKLETQVAALTEEMQKMKTAMEEPKKADKPAKAEAKNPNKSFEDGEALFKGGKFKEAILAYQKYRDANPKGKFYADATFKMGVCFQEVGLKDEAKVFYEEVTSKFPGSKDAKKAAQRLKQLK